MEIFERLQERLPDTGEVQRIVLFGRETGARQLSAVLVRLPAAHEFSLHTHPGSEDCFFVLSGSGEALEPTGRLPIAAATGVWIPAGHPHGLRAGSGGMLELGFQSPPDHTAVPFESALAKNFSSSLMTHPLRPPPRGRWTPAFPERRSWRYLDACYAVLESSQGLTVGSEAGESAIVVASGEIEVSGPPRRRLPAFSAVRLAPRSPVAIQAAASPTLLIAVQARAAA